MGRKGRDFFRKRGAAITAEYVNIFAGLGYAQAQEIAERIRELYASEAVDAVDVIYNEYKSAMVQRLTVERFLPIAPIEPAATAPASGSAPLVDYIYEQPPEELFKALLYRYADVEIYRALIESAAAEFAAKMTAMGAATEKALGTAREAFSQDLEGLALPVLEPGDAAARRNAQPARKP